MFCLTGSEINFIVKAVSSYFCFKRLAGKKSSGSLSFVKSGLGILSFEGLLFVFGRRRRAPG